MQRIKWIMAGIFDLGMALPGVLTAQTVSNSIPLSGPEVSALGSLSGDEHAAFLNLLAATPTIPTDALPRGGQMGTFWSLQNPLGPPGHGGLPTHGDGQALL